MKTFDKLFWAIWSAVILAMLWCAASPASAGHCRQCFHHKAVVAPVVVAPVYYSVGENYRTDAIVEKAIQRFVQKVQAGEIQLNAPALQQTAPPSALQSCLRCHSGPQAKGGVDLSLGSLDCKTKLRWMEMAGLDKDVPPEMKAVMAGLRQGNGDGIADITEAILKAETSVAAPAQGGLE